MVSISKDDIEFIRAQVVNTPVQEMLERVIENQRTPLQDYYLLNIELMIAQSEEDSTREDKLLEQMDEAWWKLSREDAEIAQLTHSLLAARYHEIHVASEDWRYTLAHQELDKEQKTPKIE